MSGNDSVLLDTNAVIDYFRRPETIEVNFDTHDLFLCDIVLGELYGGANKSDRPDHQKQLIEDFIPMAEILIKNLETTRIYGQLWAELANKGEMIPTNDLWIAALGVQHGLPVITRDKHFANVTSLTVEDWTASN